MRVTTRLLAGALLLVSFIAAGLVPATAVQATDGAALSSETVYRIDPDRPAVTVEATYVMTNTRQDKNLGGGRYEYYFFNGMIAPIDDGATEISVQVNGRDGRFEIVEEDGFSYVDVDFGYELRLDKSATIVVRWVLLGDAPRTEESIIRVNPAYASFSVYAWADPGRASIRIEAPADWEHEYTGDDLAMFVEDGVRVFEAIDIADPDAWFVWFTARNDDLLLTTEIDVGDASFEIFAWPNDAEWQSFAEEQITAGIPVLEALLGDDWPFSDPIDVIEASTAYLSGYAGFFDIDGGFIEVGEDLDRQTFLHELSHAWVNSDQFVKRWLSEGIAEDISAQALLEFGDERPAPQTAEELRADGWEVTTFPLETWTRGPHLEDDGAETYGYATSYRVLDALRSEIGDDRMPAVLAEVLADRRAYPDDDGPVEAQQLVDWRRFLDLAEQVGASEDWQQTLIELVLTDSQIDELGRRNEAVVEYQALADRGERWTPPAAVRSAMATWSFYLAAAHIEDAHEALDGRDRLVAALAPIDLHPVAALEADYEDTLTTATDGLLATLDEHTEAAEELVTARDELTDILDVLGLEAPTIDQAAYESAPTTLDDDTRQLVALARSLVDSQRELDAVADDLGVEMPMLEEDAFVIDPSGARALIGDRLEAALSVAALRQQRAGADAVAVKIGLLRSDVDERIDALDEQLENDEFAAVEAERAQLIEDIDELDEIGLRRITFAGGAFAIMMLALLAFVIVRRCRRAARSTIEPGTAVGGTGEVEDPLDERTDACETVAAEPGD